MSQPRSSEQQEVGAGRRHLTALRRSPRLIKMKKMGASDQDRILALKKERKALIQIRKERIVRDGNLEEYLAGAATYVRDRHQGTTGPNQPQDCKATTAEGSGNKRKKKVIKEGDKRKTKVVKRRVPQKAIDFMILNRHSRKPYPWLREEHLGKRPESFRESYYEAVAMANNLMEYEESIVKQFRKKGYAYDYFEVTDDEEENDSDQDTDDEEENDSDQDN